MKVKEVKHTKSRKADSDDGGMPPCDLLTESSRLLISAAWESVVTTDSVDFEI